MSSKYLSLGEILRLHFQVIEDFGGSHGILDEGRLVSAVAAPKQTVFGEEQYPSIYQKAAVYVRNIISDHPFKDGNKRTAIVVCSTFLSRNELIVKADPIELADFAVKVATDHLSIEEISIWLQNHCNNR